MRDRPRVDIGISGVELKCITTALKQVRKQRCIKHFETECSQTERLQKNSKIKRPIEVHYPITVEWVINQTVQYTEINQFLYIVINCKGNSKLYTGTADIDSNPIDTNCIFFSSFLSFNNKAFIETRHRIMYGTTNAAHQKSPKNQVKTTRSTRRVAHGTLITTFKNSTPYKIKLK
jgi:hypothetical protein